MSRGRNLSLLAFAMVLASVVAPTAPNAARGQQLVFSKEVYQDFRGKKSLLDELKMIGPDRDQVAKSEQEGLRIALPKTRKSNQPVGVRLKFTLAGDFEITATCEILAAEKPPPNGAVGAALNLIVSNDYKKFAKLGWFMLPEGTSYVAECRLPGKPNLVKTTNTNARTGQYRLIREGAKLRYLIADEPENVFRPILETQFTDEELEIVRLGVNNNGTPAGVDARLLDLRIRHGDVVAKSGPGPAVKPPDQAKPGPDGPSVPEASVQPARGWLTASLLVGLGLAVLLTLALAIAGFMFLRGRGAATPETASTFTCAECGKTLKVKPELAGKKVKCSGCGKLVVMPGAE